MADLKALRPAAELEQEKVLEQLEEFVRARRAGGPRVVAFAIAAVSDDGHVYMDFRHSGGQNYYALIGGLEHAKATLISDDD